MFATVGTGLQTAALGRLKSRPNDGYVRLSPSRPSAPRRGTQQRVSRRPGGRGLRRRRRDAGCDEVPGCRSLFTSAVSVPFEIPSCTCTGSIRSSA